MTVTANIHEAKTTLSKLIERALAGEEVIIAKAGKPLVELKPVRQATSVEDRMAILGKYEGQMILSDDWEKSAFDAEMHRKWFGEDPPLSQVAEPNSRFDPE
jgi:prevent-host-death family protein